MTDKERAKKILAAQRQIDRAMESAGYAKGPEDFRKYITLATEATLAIKKLKQAK